MRSVTAPNTLTPTAEESEEFGALYTDISTYVEEMTTKFITGEEPMERYDDFVKSLKTNFNVERYIEIEQKMYDRYLKR